MNGWLNFWGLTSAAAQNGGGFMVKIDAAILLTSQWVANVGLNIQVRGFFDDNWFYWDGLISRCGTITDSWCGGCDDGPD